MSADAPTNAAARAICIIEMSSFSEGVHSAVKTEPLQLVLVPLQPPEISSGPTGSRRDGADLGALSKRT